MFHPGETVCHQFIIPFVAVELSKVIITYKQDDHIILVKELTSGFEKYETKAQSIISVTFSQEESLLFDDFHDYRIQLNVFTKEGARAASCEIKQSTGVQHYKEVITNG